MNILKMYLRNRFMDADGTEGGDDNTGDDQEEPRTFTQEEVNELIKNRIARERKKLGKEQTQDKEEEKPKDKPVGNEPDNKKLNEMEMKLLCYDHEIAKEYSKKAIALAQAYLDDETDIDEALEKVVEDFPQFKKGYSEDDQKQKSWGERQTKPPVQKGGVEEAFKRKNPDLKF